MRLWMLMEKLRRLPVFTLNDLAKFTSLKPSSVRMLVWRMTKKGAIRRIERSKYTAIDDLQIVATYLVRPSYLGLYSALRFHNLTTQMVNAIDIIVPKPRKTIQIGNQKIFFTKTRHFWGFEKYRSGGFELLISDPEKTILDCVLSEKVRPHIIVECLEDGNFVEARLFSYVEKIGSAAVAKRVGYLLSKTGHNAEQYLKFASGPYVKLDPKGKSIGRKNKQWKIIENVVIE